MFQLSKYMGPAQRAWNEGIQKRVSTTADVVGSIKEAKMLGTVDSWLKAIQGLRIRELKLSKKFRTLIVYMNLLGKLNTGILRETSCD